MYQAGWYIMSNAHSSLYYLHTYKGWVGEDTEGESVAVESLLDAKRRLVDEFNRVNGHD